MLLLGGKKSCDITQHKGPCEENLAVGADRLRTQDIVLKNSIM